VRTDDNFFIVEVRIIKPVTFSLGKWPSIENKEHSVHLGLVLAIENTGFSKTAFFRMRIEQKWSRQVLCAPLPARSIDDASEFKEWYLAHNGAGFRHLFDHRFTAGFPPDFGGAPQTGINFGFLVLNRDPIQLQHPSPRQSRSSQTLN
jgi:hypothetical protein